MYSTRKSYPKSKTRLGKEKTMSAIVLYTGQDSEVMNKALKTMVHRGESSTAIETEDGQLLGSIRGRAFSDGSLRFSSHEGSAIMDGFLISSDVNEPEWAREILRLYEDQGEGFLKDLEGPFALAVSTGGKTLIARDPLGLKPLYYGHIGQDMLFASELKAVSSVCSDVAVFPPGNFFTFDKGFQEYSTFDELINPEIDGVDRDQAIDNVRRTLENSVEKRLASIDCEPVVFLSGGLDSSCIAAVTSLHIDNLKTFTVGYNGGEDPEFARVVSEHLNTEHIEYLYDLEDMLQVLPEVIYHLESFDPLLVRSAIPNYIVSKLAAEKGFSFVFMGEGADELFAGYDYMKRMESGESVEAELLRITENAHLSGFLRDDRMALAHGLEYDVPFMDLDMLNLAFSLPLKWKMHGSEKVEKWILRKAFESELPDEVVWRKKEKFSAGAGSYDIMSEYAEKQISDSEFEANSDGATVRSKEELLYFRIFKEYFPCKGAIETVYQN